MSEELTEAQIDELSSQLGGVKCLPDLPTFSEVRSAATSVDVRSYATSAASSAEIVVEELFTRVIKAGSFACKLVRNLYS